MSAPSVEDLADPPRAALTMGPQAAPNPGAMGPQAAPNPGAMGPQAAPNPGAMGPAITPASHDGLRAALGIFSGFALLALVSAIATPLAIPMPRDGAALRAWHHAFDAAEALGVGAVAGALVGLWIARVRLPWVAGVAVHAAVLAPIIHVAVGSDLYRQSSVALRGRLETAIFVALVALVALAIPAAHAIAAWLSRWPILRWIPIVIALATMIAAQAYFRDDYFGVHAVVSWAAAVFAGTAFAPLAERAARAAWRRAYGRAALALIALVAALGVVVPPPNRIRIQLFRNPCAVAPWALATVVWRAPGRAIAPSPSAPIIAPAWLGDRAALPPIAPTTPRLFARNPVVVLITVDALRADAIDDPANDRAFPTFTEIKSTGARFTRATAPGSQTAVSLSATFSGRYFSQLYWSMHGTGETRFAYPADDPTPRFPKLLTDAGVETAIFCSINFLAGDFGVARGFAEEKVIPEGRKHALGRQMIDPVLERLKHVSERPLFIYVHLMEPHSPYDRGRRNGTDRERYLSEVAVADAQIARVLRVLKQSLPDRGVLIVAADHGEAFGEHETVYHTKTLYEELLRVPILVRGPNVARRAIDERVGLVDLGPTLLDLFGVPTPATFMGQSLVPLLAGRAAKLDRPLLAEGRLRRALYTPDSLKVIEDDRRKVVEVYDLVADPRELDNVFDARPDRAEPALAALRAFFAAHALRKAGYSPPYKP